MFLESISPAEIRLDSIKEFSRSFPILFHQGRTTSVQLEALHFLNLSRSDSYLQYRHSGEVRRGEAEKEETWKYGGSRKIASRSGMGLREAERIFKVISRPVYSLYEKFRLSVRYGR